ncbi:MAG TPA: polymer-forming cytoskeletal protein [Steroidobacteraceae bacterium]|nr:polymer-forming cytoskeletal protein [Steroidobacteraceae bacterium]
MALWKEPVAPGTNPSPPINPAPREPAVAAVTPMTPDVQRRPRERTDAKESIIASDLTIEGKIEGTGHVRIAGSFKGDVHVQGNLTIEAGARLTGQVRASTVTVGGELQGNIEAAARVELLETGVVAGDVKAGSLTVAAGSRMRGQVEFGWEEKAPRSFGGSKVDLAAS